MNTYYVTFHYTVEVQADDHEQADTLAWQTFADSFGQVSAGDFVSSEPEEMWWKETV